MDFFPLHKKSNQCCVGSFLKCLLNLFISSLLPLSLGFYCLFHGWLSETFIYLPLVSLFANFRPIFIILTYAIKLILTISHNSYYAIIVMYLNYCFGHVIAYMRKLMSFHFLQAQMQTSWCYPTYIVSHHDILYPLLLNSSFCFPKCHGDLIYSCLWPWHYMRDDFFHFFTSIQVHFTTYTAQSR